MTYPTAILLGVLAAAVVAVYWLLFLRPRLVYGYMPPRGRTVEFVFITAFPDHVAARSCSVRLEHRGFAARVLDTSTGKVEVTFTILTRGSLWRASRLTEAVKRAVGACRGEFVWSGMSAAPTPRRTDAG